MVLLEPIDLRALPPDGDMGNITVVGGDEWTITPGVVTLAKMADLAPDQLIGRAAGAGSGPPQAITLGANLSIAGTTLNAAGGGGSSLTAATLTVPYGLTQFSEGEIIDAAITPASLVFITWGMISDLDENTPDMDAINFAAVPEAGSMIVRVSTLTPLATVGGTYKINYLVST